MILLGESLGHEFGKLEFDFGGGKATKPAAQLGCDCSQDRVFTDKSLFNEDLSQLLSAQFLFGETVVQLILADQPFSDEDFAEGQVLQSPPLQPAIETFDGRPNFA